MLIGWKRLVFIYIYGTAERDNARGEEAVLRLRTFAVITAGDNRYSLNRIGEKFTRGESYKEILDYAERTYSAIESVRQWVKEDPDAKEELYRSGINNVDFF